MLDLSETGIGLDLVQAAERVGFAAIVLPVAALLALLGAVAADRDRRRAVVRCGVAIAVAGIVVVAFTSVCGLLATGLVEDESERAAIAGIWAALCGDLVTWGLAIAAVGTFITGVAAALVRPVDAEEWTRLAWIAIARTPARRGWRVARGIVLIAAGALMIAEPGWMARALIVLLGLGVLYVGVAELVRLTLPAGSDPRERERAARTPLRTAAAVAVAGVAVLGLAALAISEATGEGDAVAGPITECNGSAELCDRTLDEVALAATHNSMSAAGYPNFLFPMQDRTIPGQLDDGIRGLLIDAYYGYPGRTVYTDFDRSPSKLLAIAREQFGQQFVDAANQIRAQIAKPQPGAESKPYLCHGFCELGAIDLVDTFRRIGLWLDANPHEFLVIVIEDYVAPEDIVAAAVETGLAAHVYRGADGPPWPTLREMIESDQRVLLTAENKAGAASWYRQAFEIFQETPYEFATPAQLATGCGPNRGAAGNSLFQINNWINTDPAALPSNAAKVNAFQPLLDRARLCESERGLLPNLIAVDFYREGDPLGVVNELNGVGG